MTSFRDRLDAAREQLPPGPLAALASLCFSLAVVTAPFEFFHPPKFLTYLSVKLFGAAFYAFALHWLLHRPPVHLPPIKLPLAAFLCTNLISAWWGANLALNRRTWYMILIVGVLVLAGNVIVTAGHLEILCQVLFLESAAGGLAGIWQFARQYQAIVTQHPDQIYPYMTVARIHIRGFTVYPVHFGCQQMLLFVALLAFVLISRRARRVWWGVEAIIGVSVAVNLTRSAWVGCFGAGVYLAARWRRRWLWLLPVVFVASFLVAPSLLRDRIKSITHPSADLSITHRFELWNVALRMMSKHPWAGVGPENVERVYALYLPAGQTPIPFPHAHLHNNLLQLGAERGLPALAAWIGLMLTLLWQFWKIRRILFAMRWVADAGIAAWLAMMVQGLFDYNFGIFSALILFLFLASTPFVAQEIEKRQRPEATNQD